MKSYVNNSRGQMTVELTLLSIVIVALALSIGKFLKDNDVLGDLVQQPWTNRFAGMIENGVWGGAAATRAQHPNLISRHSSLRGDPAQ